MSNLSASDINILYTPSKCARRVYLSAKGELEGEPSDFDKLLEELGRRHEENHLAAFTAFEDMRSGTIEERYHNTLGAIESGKRVIYQGVLQAQLPSTGDMIVGMPDFLLKDGDGYRIRDCKLSRHVGEGRHEEIKLQLELYGWLFEQSVHRPPVALELYLGDESLVPIPYDGDATVTQTLEAIKALSTAATEPYSPVGWSKCGGCGFKPRCWEIAENAQDVALVYGVDQGTVTALRERGVYSIEQLLSQFDGDSLAALNKPHGKKMVRVGKASTRILQQANALKHKRESLIKPLDLPVGDNLVMFDLEGLPPQFDELDKVYLWGTQVYGKRPGAYLPALTTFGADGDWTGWEQFLSNCDTIFREYGDIPFVHWHNYETTKVRSYIGRFGDPNGIGDRVLRNCVDLLRVTHDALVLPEYSYSLKVVEKRAGFKRTMTEYGGNWSIVQYIRAVETQDDSLRQTIMADILKYNEEDLAATWAVLEWLRGFE